MTDKRARTGVKQEMGASGCGEGEQNLLNLTQRRLILFAPIYGHTHGTHRHNNNHLFVQMLPSNLRAMADPSADRQSGKQN